MLQRLLQRRLHWLCHGLAHHCIVEFAQDKISFSINVISNVFNLNYSAKSRKQKTEILGTKRTIPADVDSNGQPIEPDDATDETVFSATLAPKELYSELLHSYSATGIIDLSPGQGELIKASLLCRTKCLVLAGTDKHAAALELAATDFLLQELRREGSTFYRAEAAKKDDDVKEEATEPKRSDKKKRTPRKKVKFPRKRRRRRSNLLSRKKKTKLKRKSLRRKKRKRPARSNPKKKRMRMQRGTHPSCGEWILVSEKSLIWRWLCFLWGFDRTETSVRTDHRRRS